MTRPTLAVYLDDGTDTYPYNISAYVSLTEPCTIIRGRQDENPTITAGVLQLTLDNSDGRFTLGSGTYGIALNQKIRVKVNTLNRFTGYVQSWPLQWAPVAKQAFARITAVDEIARLQRWEMRSLLEEEILARTPFAYYTMGDPAGSTQAVDSSGNSAAPLTAIGSGTAVSFGVATGPSYDGLTAATFTASGQYMTAPQTTTLAAAHIAYSRSGIPAVTSPTPLFWTRDNEVESIWIQGGTGYAAFAPGTGSDLVSTINVCDGNVHSIGVVWDGSDAYLVVDGTSVGSTVATGIKTNTIWVGQDTEASGTSGISHVALFSGPSLVTVAQMQAIGAAVGNTGTSHSLIQRLAAIAGAPSNGSMSSGLTTVNLPDVTGSTIADVLTSIGAAEVGRVFCNESGQIDFINRAVAPAKTSADITIALSSTALVTAETTVEGDMADVVNYAAGRANREDATDQVVLDTASIVTSRHGKYPRAETYWVSTDDEARDRAGWLVGNHKQPSARISRLKLDYLTATSGQVTACYVTGFGQRIAITGWPTQAPAALSDLEVQGWTEVIGRDEWSMTLNTTSWSLNAAWILNDATYSVLDSTTKLYI